MNGSESAELARDAPRTGHGPPPDDDASMSQLIAAMGRVVRFGGELVLLEARAVRRAARRVAKYHTATWMCALTGWLALNGGLASLAYTRLGIDPGLVLLSLALANAALAGLMNLLRKRGLRELTHSPLLDFLGRRF